MFKRSKIPSHGSSGLKTLLVLGIHRTFYSKLALILCLLVQETPQTTEQPSCITGSSNPAQLFSYSHFFWCFVLVLIPGNILLLLPAKLNLAICAQYLIPTVGACLAGDFFQTLPFQLHLLQKRPHICTSVLLRARDFISRRSLFQLHLPPKRTHICTSQPDYLVFARSSP